MKYITQHNKHLLIHFFNLNAVERNQKWNIFLIPLTLTSAVVFCPPKTQLYSPTSSGCMFLMVISANFPFSTIWILPPWQSWSSPFHHCTGTPALDSSQRRHTLPPSGASWFLRPDLNVRGMAAETKIKTGTCRNLYTTVSLQ